MREPLKDLLDQLGVGYILSSYETCPWSAFDDENGISCSAEVRMNNDADELEAELQFMRDAPQEGELPLEQICYIMAKPATGDKWDVKIAKVKGEQNPEEKYGWEEKVVKFFNACVQELKMGKVPDIKELMERELNVKDRFGDQGRGAGSKSPKIKPQALMGMKGGRGF